MSKHKTRQQKIIADLHRKLQRQNADSTSQQQSVSFQSTPRTTTYSYTLATPQPFQKKQLTGTATMPYLRGDLHKTMLVTAAIITSQLLLYYVLKTHLISFPIVGY